MRPALSSRSPSGDPLAKLRRRGGPCRRSGRSVKGLSGAGFSGGSYSGQAIGNQLNVITNGNYNTVIVNSTQINNGNQTATSSTALNGKIDLND